MSTILPATCASPCKPGIYCDEVHRHPVGITRGQQERFLNVVSNGFDIVAAADISILAACGDFATAPALEVVRIAEVCG